LCEVERQHWGCEFCAADVADGSRGSSRAPCWLCRKRFPGKQRRRKPPRSSGCLHQKSCGRHWSYSSWAAASGCMCPRVGHNAAAMSLISSGSARTPSARVCVTKRSIQTARVSESSMGVSICRYAPGPGTSPPEARRTRAPKPRPCEARLVPTHRLLTNASLDRGQASPIPAGPVAQNYTAALRLQWLQGNGRPVAATLAASRT
jgi:hypothetical protein